MSLSSVACFALMLVFVEGRGTCPPGKYWDHALGKCDECSSICDYMDQQGTAKSCQSNCPGYRSSQNVLSKPGQNKHIDDKDTQSAEGVRIGVPVAAICIIIIISIVVAALLLRRRRRNPDTPVISQIEDTSAPMLSTGHTLEQAGGARP